MIPQHCRHKTYPSAGAAFPKTCAAGVCYADVTLTDPALGPIWNRQPCDRRGRKNGATCEKFAPWTQEEIDAAEREMSEIGDRITVARRAIITAHGRARGVKASMPCPVCATGMLHYSIASTNGHIHATCSVSGCVRWME